MSETEHPSLPPRPPERAPTWTRRSLVFGLVALFLGGWLLADALGVAVPPLSRHWPLFVAIGGLASAVDFFAISRRPAALGLGVLGLGLGSLLYCLTLGVTRFGTVADWGPALPLVIGLSFLASWLAGGAENTSLLALGLVGIGLAITFWGWLVIRLEVLWSVIFLVVGSFFVWRVVTRGRSKRS